MFTQFNFPFQSPMQSTFANPMQNMHVNTLPGPTREQAIIRLKEFAGQLKGIANPLRLNTFNDAAFSSVLSEIHKLAFYVMVNENGPVHSAASNLCVESQRMGLPFCNLSVIQKATALEKIINDLLEKMEPKQAFAINDLEQFKRAATLGKDLTVSGRLAGVILSLLSKMEEEKRSEPTPVKEEAKSFLFQHVTEQDRTVFFSINQNDELEFHTTDAGKEQGNPMPVWKITAGRNNKFVIYKYADNKYVVVYNDRIQSRTISKENVRDMIFCDENGAPIGLSHLSIVEGLDCDRLICMVMDQGPRALYSVSEGFYQEFFA